MNKNFQILQAKIEKIKKQRISSLKNEQNLSIKPKCLIPQINEKKIKNQSKIDEDISSESDLSRHQQQEYFYPSLNIQQPKKIIIKEPTCNLHKYSKNQLSRIFTESQQLNEINLGEWSIIETINGSATIQSSIYGICICKSDQYGTTFYANPKSIQLSSKLGIPLFVIRK